MNMNAKNAKKITEALQSFSDPPLKKCGCGGKLEKLISLSSFQLTGTGWYATDYVKNAGIPPKAQAQNNPSINQNENESSNNTSPPGDKIIEDIKTETNIAKASNKRSKATN